MLFFLSKFLPQFIYPLGLACVLLILALLVRKRPRWQTILVALVLALLFLGSNKIVAMTLMRSLEWRHVPSPSAPEPQADVIVVLGGGTHPKAFPRPTTELDDAGDRLLYAAHLYRQGAAPRMLVSGGKVPLLGPASVSEAESMADILTAMGVPREVVWLEPASRNTYENAVETHAFLESQGITRIILVTSASHMPRAYALFAKTGLDVVPAPTDFWVTHQDWAFYTQPDVAVQMINLLPKVDSLEATTRALKEYVGIGVYWLLGRV